MMSAAPAVMAIMPSRRMTVAVPMCHPTTAKVIAYAISSNIVRMMRVMRG